ncbi:MAG: DoxX family protein [Caldilineaceae bacterium]|nr:DoxX family protein [Caldilineaceae bacterium]
MSFDFAILVIRVIVGLTIAAHGAQKFGLFGGPGLQGMSGWLTSMRMRPALFWAVLAGLSELGGGLLMALGFLGPIGALGVMAAMAVAAIGAHWGRFFVTNQGMEYPIVIAAAALATVISGSGAYSLDAVLGLHFPEPLTSVGGLILVVVGVALAFGTRAPAPATQA